MPAPRAPSALWPGPAWVHVDLDAFFAQVEELDNPSLRGKPVVVGARRRPDGTVGRGVASTANYEARKYGIRSAMPLATCIRLCPHAEFVPGRFDRYRELSARVMEVASGFGAHVHQGGIDEAYLDLTGLERWAASLDPIADAAHEDTWPARVGTALKHAVRAATGLTCSVGVAPNRFLAKIASDFRKPDGLTVVHPERVREFVSPLPIEKLRGVGAVTAERLRRLGYATGGELIRDDRAHVAQLLGEWGAHVFDLCLGAPQGPPDDAERKSISHETTFPEDIADHEVLLATVSDLAARLAWKLRTKGLRAGCIGLKLRYADFHTITRDRSLADHAPGAGSGIGFTDQESDIVAVAGALLRTELADRSLVARPIRLIGIRVSHLSAEGHRQLELGEVEAFDRRDAIAKAADAVRARMGYGAIRPARATDRPGRKPRPEDQQAQRPVG
jgi:DNA polymerase-4